ncbi:MAG: branched-chain amino acid ABC transporter permease [Candidatus Dormibacteraeota bacterium]|uniref:Branched-chain amino acid ABC transporter permease n=1 Tax=Candidatus Dormiibacter inghamiae TaxID=3127013 RepID=A0A934NF39_9BACT|nr:branched-chain amino acid ABC transporter permease [Candidatus Dormibacteraeota bacterium]MBJ7606182.1 branched-chain amino acid ABC transporter permease [Candidatus Dormibacteraeota bacterium]
MGSLVRLVSRHGRAAQIGGLVVVVLICLAIPQLGSSFYVSLGLSVLIYGLLAMSLDLLAGYTGLVSLGHASFLGVGAYGVAFGLSHGLDVYPAIGLALGAVAVTAAVFGLVAVRVKEITFVILTLALGQLVWGLAFRWVAVSGGDNGLPVAGRPSLGPIDLTDNGAFYYFVLAIVMACAAILWAIVHSPFGLSLQGIKDNEARMRTLGYNVVLHKYLAFTISAVFGGVAGILFAFFNLYVSPTMIDFNHNGTVVQMAVVGGLGTLWGPVLGAIVIVLMQQFVSIYIGRWVTLLGIIFVVTVLFARTGLWGGLRSAVRRLAVHYGAEPPVGPASVATLETLATEGGQ